MEAIEDMREMTKDERRRRIQHLKKIQRIKERAAKAKNKVSGKFMNRVVICMILAALIFTVVIIIVFVRVGSEPSTLIENVFRFLSVESGAMALIKSVKTVTKTKSNGTETQSEYEPEQSEEEL
jgi:uncharacterized membrane protein